MTRKWRPWVLGGLALLAFAVATALAAPTVTRGAYDPQSAAPEGSRAVAELLRGQGLTVERTTDSRQALSVVAGQTLVVANPGLLPRAAVRQLETVPADVVLLGPVRTPGGFLGITAAGPTSATERPPGCEVPAAVASGSARTHGPTLLAPADDGFASCYPTAASDPAQGAAMVQTVAGPSRTVFGSGDFLTNKSLEAAGNAALAMNVLGANATVVWWLPAPMMTGTQPLSSVLPDGVWPVLAVVVVLVGGLALWQGRRLGPVVHEPLPVAVSASETTEGRARIYQRHRTRGQAAYHLRALTIAELSRCLGLPAGADPTTLAVAVSTATGHPAEQVTAILYGPPPERDDDLVALGRQLADLDREVRRS